MKSGLLGTAAIAAIMLLGPVSWASDKPGAGAPQSETDLARRITHEIRMYPNYGIWDNLNFRISGTSVELTGEVNQPYKKTDIERLVQRVPGVASVTNLITVLPLSPMDDRLRLQVARAIYADPTLSRYGMGSLPSIHIIVENGHVTLDGTVSTDMDKQIAAMRASSAGLSFGPVTNNLQVERLAKRS
jgi:hyperosmotically inducible protein